MSEEDEEKVYKIADLTDPKLVKLQFGDKDSENITVSRTDLLVRWKVNVFQNEEVVS